MADFGVHEMVVMLLMAFALVWLGIFPQGVLDMAAPTLVSLGVGAP